MDENYKNLSQSIQRALDVLFVFSAEEPELGIIELSEVLDLPKSTTHRLVTNLEVRGFLEQNPITGKYRLGMTILELGMRMWRQIDLVGTVQPFIRELSIKTGESTVLAVLSDGDVIYLDKVDSQHSIRAISAVGQRRPPHCTALGKVFLSSLPTQEVWRILGQKPLIARTPNTITDPEQLLREIALVREQGFSVDREEFDLGLCCLAAPITNGAGSVVAAIGIAGPTSRVHEATIDGLIEELRATANSISEQVRYSVDATLPVTR